MSGTSSTSVVAGGVGDVGGGCYYKPPFTAVQWQELEHQAMVYKYLLAGLPVPPELVVPIRRSFEAISSRFFSNPALGYYSYYGKKFDPEPGRCRRTDGKKWRCAKDAYPDSRYCERHMHRGRNRSRKPVESHSTSQSVSSATSHVVVTGGSSSSGIFQNSGSATFQNMPLHSAVNSDSLYSGSSLTKLQMDPGLYGSSNKDYRYVHGFTSDADPGNYSPEASGNVRSLGVGSDIGSAWCLLPSQVSSSSLLRSQNEHHHHHHQQQQQQLLGQSLELDMGHALDPMVEATLSKQQQRQKQHSLFSNNDIGSMKQEPHAAMRPFFDEWPSTTKESWSNLDHGGGSDKSNFSKTHLSISIPMSSTSEFSPGDASCSPDGEYK